MAAEPGTWFGVLGPLQLRHAGVDGVDGSAGAEITVDRPQRRMLIALLLAHANRVLGMDEIIDHLWPAGPPATARTQVHALVSAVRRVLPDSDSVLRTESSGYRIAVRQDALDLLDFTARLDRAGAAADAGDRTGAIGTYRTALALWRGEPFAGLDAGFLTPIRRGLIEKRLVAVEKLAELELSGDTTEPLTGLVDELTELVARHPLRTGLRQWLMLALYRDGQAGRALRVYRQGRDLLVDEHGMDPAPELDRLAHRIRRGDPVEGAGGPPAGARPVDRTVPPRQLPYAVTRFTGRQHELARLDAVPRPDRTAVVVVSGTGGVGKTALATYWAHAAADRFTDGQLYVDLRGYAPGAPVPPADVLAGFLRALGVAGQEVPHDLADRSALFASLLRNRTVLVLLDNARDAEQVLPLLPPATGAPGCVVLVTSRDRLDTLAERHDVTRIVLDLLPLPDAVALLADLIGDRVDADRPTGADTATELAIRCARLPLALRIAAERAASRPRTPLTELVAELADERRVLDLLDTGDDPHTAVPAVLSWSYRQLSPGAARALRLLGTHRGPDLDLAAVVALTGTTDADARCLLAELVRAHLVDEVAPGRYGMHDLLRAWTALRATDPTGRETDLADRRAATRRLFDYFAHAAAVAMDLVYPYERYQRPPAPASGYPPPDLARAGLAHQWLDTELPNLLALAGSGQAPDQEQAAEPAGADVTTLCATVWRHLDNTGRYDEASTLAERAAAVAGRRDDRAALAAAHTVLGLVCWRRGRYERATAHLSDALTGYGECDDAAGQAWAMVNLGVVYERTQRFDLAVEQLRRAIALYQRLGEAVGLATALGNLGVVYEQTHSYDLAVQLQKRSFALHLDADNPVGQANALGNVGIVHLRTGRHEQAQRCLRQALTLFRRIRDRAGEAEALGQLGAVAGAIGDHDAARDWLESALTVARDIGNRRVQALALNGFGELALAAGDTGAAGESYRAALRHAGEIGDREQRDRAQHGLEQVRGVMSNAQRCEPSVASSWSPRQVWPERHGPDG